MAKKYANLGRTLKKLLFDHEMKAIDLARAVALPAPTIHRLITGKTTRPYESSLKPIADFFAIDVKELLGDLDNSKKVPVIHQVPLIPWIDLDQRNEPTMEQVPFAEKIGNLGFATLMPDTSMEPLIQRNSILIFDSDFTITDRSYVLVKLKETNGYVVRQLLIDAEHQYLKPLNPDLEQFNMRLLKKNDQIIANLIEIRHNLSLLK